MSRALIKKASIWLIVLTLAAASFASGGAAAEEAAGTAGLWISSSNQAIDEKGSALKVATDINGVNYLLYSEGGTTGKPKVKKFDGLNWITVGGEYVADTAIVDSRLVIAGTTPYVAYSVKQAGVTNNSITVKKLEDNTWVEVGAPGSLAGGEFNLFVNGDTLYLAVFSASGTKALSVMTYNSEQGWIRVGQSEVPDAVGGSPSMTMMDSKLYVAFTDTANGNGNKATVVAYNEQAQLWEPVGNRAFTEGAVRSLVLTSGGGKLYVAFYDSVNPRRGMVMTYIEGSGWLAVGDYFSDGTVAALSAFTAAKGNPYVAYKEGPAIKVKTYVANGWVQVGDELTGFSPALSIRQNGYYLAYVKGSLGSGPVYVMQLNDKVGFSLSGVPKDGKVNLTWQAVTGAVGYQVYRGSASGQYGVYPEAIMGSGSTTYASSGLVNGQAYYYKVRALLADGSTESNEVSYTPQAALPSAPQHFSARAAGSGEVQLNWLPVSDANGIAKRCLRLPCIQAWRGWSAYVAGRQYDGNVL
jgi:hypothetical protein